MSLLDDVSIVVTPNGYKAGELYAVVPVPTEGTEEIDDGSFANDLDDWSKYGVTSATGGIATIGASANSGIYQTILTQGVRYTVTINVTSYDGVGLAQVTNGNGTVLYLITETGIQTFTFISAIASGQIILRGMSNALFSLSSVSVKEYTSADMDVTRATDATRVDENGLIADVLSGVPRIDYTGGGCPHILAEPQRTNLITYSEDFSDSSWTKLGAGTGSTAVVTSNYAISPDGTQNATRLVCDLNGGTTTSDQSLIYDLDSSNTSQSISIYIKSNTGSNQNIYFANTFGTGDTSIVTSDWQRFEFNHSTSNHTFSLGLRGNTGADDTADILIWGAQSESGSYPTSYIPTSGSTVTRNQDIFTRDGIGSLINSTEGVLFVEMERSEEENSYRLLGLDDGTVQNYIKIGFGDVSGNFWIRAVVNGVTVLNSDNTVSNNSNQFYKIAVRYKSGDSVIYIDGVPILTSATTFSSGAFTNLDFTHYTGGLNFFGKVKQLQVYKTALTDTQLAALTS